MLHIQEMLSGARWNSSVWKRCVGLQIRVYGLNSYYTEQHLNFQETIRKVIDKEINPHVAKWEQEKMFPAHEVFKKMAKVGVLGVEHPPKYGGLGLDFSYSLAAAEALGHIKCGAIPMAVAVQAEMATQALANFGSDKLKQEFLTPTISGDYVACLGVSEAHAGSDVSSVLLTAH